MSTALLLLLAGGAGGLARFVVVGTVQRYVDPHLPLGTAVVNVVGAVALGALVVLEPGGTTLDIVGTGFLGGFTTFSTWMVESVGLAGTSSRTIPWAAVANVVGMAILGIVAVQLTGVLVT